MTVRYWSMRTDKKQPSFFYSELREGRLRQGWGYSEGVDLRKLKEFKDSGAKLTDKQRDAWRGNKRLLPTEQDSIATGDIVLLPNLPHQGVWSLARVADDIYRFEIAEEFEDYGHIRHVKLLNPNVPINPYSSAVHSDLRKTMRTRMRLWNVDQHSESVDVLIDAIERNEEVGKPESGAERLASIRRELKRQLGEHLDRGFQGGEFEEVCETLLMQLYENVERTAGPLERGADFICDSTDGLKISHRVAVQVKKWSGKSDLSHPLAQIKEAYSNYEGVTSAAIITTLESITESAESAVRDISEELHIPINVLLKEDVLDLLMRSLDEDSNAGSL